MARWESFKRRQQCKEQLMDVHDDCNGNDDVSLAVDDELADRDDDLAGDDDHDGGLANDDKLDDGDNTADIANGANNDHATDEASGKTVTSYSVCTQTDMTMKKYRVISRAE